MVAFADGQRITVPLPAVTIYPGDLITRELIVEREVVWRGSVYKSFHTDTVAIVGKVAARVLPAGRAVPLNAVREPYVFKEGQRVALTFGAGGLHITGAGVATQPGVVGQTVGIKNIDTGRVVRGTVMADGSVVVGEE